jgi:hypothetical protein
VFGVGIFGVGEFGVTRCCDPRRWEFAMWMSEVYAVDRVGEKDALIESLLLSGVFVDRVLVGQFAAFVAGSTGDDVADEVAAVADVVVVAADGVA